MSARPPLSLGVCSWSLQVTSIRELVRLTAELDINLVQLACGDPQHASWEEGDELPKAALASGLEFSGTMLGFPGEDYTTPATIKATGGFGDVALREERLDRLKWAVNRTVELGLSDLTLHAGFLPGPSEPGRHAFLDTLGMAARIAADKGVTLAFETGQETAALLKRTLNDISAPNLKVNFDPANMLLYDMGNPIEAVELLGDSIRSVHVKDAKRPKMSDHWGEEVPLGQGEVGMSEFVAALKRVGYTGVLAVEREVGNQEERKRDIANGLGLLRSLLD